MTGVLNIVILLLYTAAGLHITSGQDNPPVYLSNGGNNYTSNNSAILITEIVYGVRYCCNHELICHTDLVTCCRARDTGTVGMGEWYYPNGTVVPTHHAGNDFYRLRNSPQAIKLARRIHSDGSGALGPTGLYCCVIPTTIGEQRFCALILGCHTLPPLLNGMITYNPPGPPGENTVATYSCNDGYLLIGESTLTCRSGTWSYTAPYCAALCPPPPTPHNGNISFNSSLVEWFNNYTVATYSCNVDYMLIGERTRTCRSGTWSSTAPYCADSAMIQLKFAPTEYCIQWNENKASLTRSIMRGAIQEAILVEGNTSIPLEHIEQGFFSCRTSHNQTTYRTRIIGIETTSAVEIAATIRMWVESGATVRVQWYIVDIDKNCPVSISSLSEPECGQVRCDICIMRGRK